MTNILRTRSQCNEYRVKRQNHVENVSLDHFDIEKFHIFKRKCTPFEGTRFVTSSGAENYLMVYVTFVRSKPSNVNSSKFTTETNLFLRRLQVRCLKISSGGSIILKNPSLNIHTSQAKRGNRYKCDLQHYRRSTLHISQIWTFPL